MGKPQFTNIDQFLSLLQGVTPKGNNQWVALCPTHDDKDPSLNIKLADNKILLKDFGGCDNPTIIKTLGLTMSHLYLDDGSKPHKARHGGKDNTGPREVVAKYIYTDEHGKPLFRKVRYHPKSFDQESFDGKAWHTGPGCMTGVRRVLFNLPEVLASKSEDATVFWVEGEKDAINAKEQLGVIATTCSEGAGALKEWNPEYGEALLGRDVVLIPDGDKVGKRHMLFIAANLRRIARRVRIIYLPVHDISDWLPDHDKIEFFDDLLPKARDCDIELASNIGGDGNKPSEDIETEIDEPMPVTNTDTGNAVRLVRLYGDCLRYCYEAKSWYAWTGRVWQKDLGAQINHYATKTVKSIYTEASEETDTAKAKELARHAMQSESNHRIVAMIARTESQLGIPITIQEIDQDNWLLNCANGTIDLRTGELRPFNKNDYITHIIATPYDPDATCPIFDKFLDRVTRGDAELMAYIQKCVGYSLTGDTRTELVFFVYGEGQNGKSTFISTIRVLLGCYAHRVSPDIFMQLKGKSAGGPKESLANLRGKRFVAASEIEEGRRLHMSLVKSLTGAETITADRKYEHEIEWQPTHHLWISGNYRPEIRDDSIAAWRRLKIVPFTVYIPDEEKDEALKFKLLNELPGILAWAVHGCLAYQKEGLKEPQAVTQATNDYRKENDILGIFIDECCILEDDANITNKSLRVELKAWCIGSGLDSLNTHQIKRLMLARGFEQGISSGGKYRIWKGIRVRELTDTILNDSQDIDKTYGCDKSFVTNPKTPLIKAKHKKFMEKTETFVTLSQNDGVMSRPSQLGYPDYPTEPCSRCGSDLFWPGPDGWLCVNCDPRPEDG
jgi:putative DNA primase/helicase